MTAKKIQKTTATKPAEAGGRVLKGTVVKTAMKDTVTVVVKRYVQHPKYKKYLERAKKFLVHDAGNTSKVGDVVLIRETRPISKNKHFELLETVVAAAAKE
jgi:small subunit ribosomal protein S17